MNWDAAADAALKVWKGGGWQLAAAILVAIFLWNPPWGKKKPKE